MKRDWELINFTLTFPHLGHNNFELMLMCVVRPRFNSVIFSYRRIFHHIGTTCDVVTPLGNFGLAVRCGLEKPQDHSKLQDGEEKGRERRRRNQNNQKINQDHDPDPDDY